MKYLMSIGVAGALISSSAAFGQGPALPLEQALNSQYALTTATADHLDIVTAGSVLTLLKRGLLAADATNRGNCINTYKVGQIKPTASCQMMGGKMVLGQHLGGNTAVRTFVNGEKIFVTKIDVDRNKDTITFDLLSDAYNNVRYRAPLRFEFGKAYLTTSETGEVLKEIATVFSVTPPEAPATAPATPAPTSAQQRRPPMQSVPADPPPQAIPAAPVQTAIVQPDAPPPPPPPDPASISIGDTKEQVVAKMGQPQKIIKAAGGKEFYVYNSLRVIFVNGKMTDAQ